MAACVVIDLIFVMTGSKVIPLHHMKLSVIAEIEKIVTRHIL